MSDWPTAALADLGVWYGGGTPSKARKDFWGGPIPWLSPKDMRLPTLNSTVDHITRIALEQSAVKMVPAGSIAIVVRSGILERRVPVSLVPFMTTLNQDMKAISPRPDIDPRWIAWGLRAQEQQVLRTCRKAGTTVASLDTTRLSQIRLPTPPLFEQRQILAILEDHLSRLDAAGGYLTAAKRRSDRMLTASLRTFADGAARAALRTTTLAQVASWGSGGTPRAGDLRYYRGGSTPWAVIGDLTDGPVTRTAATVTELALRESSARIVPEGSVLIAMYGSIGKLGLPEISLATNQAIAYAKPNADIHRDFLFWYLRSQRSALVSAGKGGAQKNISQSVLKGWLIDLPPLDEQERLVRAIASAEEAVVQLRLQNAALVRRQEALRRALLAAAFSGRLTGRISDMDLAEELPAVLTDTR